MKTRDAILAEIRAALGRGPLSAAAAASAEGRIGQHRSGPVPARGRKTGDALVDVFISMAEGVSASVERLKGPDEIPAAVERQLAGRGLSGDLAIAPHPALKSLKWQNFQKLKGRFGKALGGDLAALTVATAGVAETGTLVFVSGPECPSDHCFLPETQIAVLRTSDLVGTYEEFWHRSRQAGGLPATINLVTGPSRTGDIEQTIQLGAHGPRRLCILLIG